MPPRLKSLLSALNQPVVALLPQGFGQHSVLQVLVVAGISDGRPWLKGSQAQLRKNLWAKQFAGVMVPGGPPGFIHLPVTLIADQTIRSVVATTGGLQKIIRNRN